MVSYEVCTSAVQDVAVKTLTQRIRRDVDRRYLCFFGQRFALLVHVTAFGGP